MFQDAQGYDLTALDAAAVDTYKTGVGLLLEYRASAMRTIQRAIELDDALCMARCLQGYMLMMFGTFSVHERAREALRAAQARVVDATPRERLHVHALALWLEGDLERACYIWDAILETYPRDILALRLQHFNAFWMGRVKALLRAPASVIDAWSPDVPGYGNVLGMLAFGLEESGNYATAEKYGREAVARNPNDLWAIHAVAHVLEMQQRHDEGVEWLSFPLDHWDDRNPFRGHLWWHLGLQLISQGKFGRALELYDCVIHNSESDFYLDIQNAASMLARLEFSGTNVGARWAALADHAKRHIDDHALVFTDLHCVMSLARTRRFDDARELVESMRAYARQGNYHVSKVMREVGIDLCEGVIAFERSEYDEAIGLITPLRDRLASIGASHAQREIVDQYLVEAARRGSRASLAERLRCEHEFLARVAR